MHLLIEAITNDGMAICIMLAPSGSHVDKLWFSDSETLESLPSPRRRLMCLLGATRSKLVALNKRDHSYSSLINS